MSDFVRTTVGKAAPPIAIIFCIGMSACLFAGYVRAERFGNDFGVYWRAANQSIETIYFWQGRFPFPYAPTMLLWVEPLSLIPKWPAYFMFVAASAAAFILAYRPYVCRSAIALALVSPPFMRGMFTGQVCAVLAALLVWASGAKNRIGAGIAFGVIASVKPQLVIMAPLMLALNRDWRAFASAGVTFLAAALLSVLIFGAERWPEWIASMGHFHGSVVNTGVIGVGITPAMWAERFGYPPLAFMLAGTLAGAATVYLCRSLGPLERSTAVAAGSLMAAPYALVYDLTPVVPLLALLVIRGRIWAALALASPWHPLPLAITVYELLRKSVTGLPVWRTRHAI